MKAKVKRLFNGLATVRDDTVDKAISYGEDLVITCGGKKMTIPHSEIRRKAIKTNESIYTSKFSGLPYQLVDFKWKPDVVEQRELFHALR